MTYLVFTSKGEIEIPALTLLGASTKRDDESKLGFFGSGIKYALAVLLRHNVEIELWSGTTRIEIETKPTGFRGQTFEVIHINGQPTSLTTETGPQWAVSDAIREVYTNAVDEGLISFQKAVATFEPKPDTTTFAIKVTPEISMMLMAWPAYFKEPGDMSFKVYKSADTAGQLVGFRRGVRVCQLEGFLFSYNVPEVQIDEQRRASRYDFSWEVAKYICAEGDDDLFEAIFANQDCQELSAIGLKSTCAKDLDSPINKWLRSNFEFWIPKLNKDRVPRAHHSKCLFVYDLSIGYILRGILPSFTEWNRRNRMPQTPLPAELEPLIEECRAMLRSVGFKAEFPIVFDGNEPEEQKLAYVDEGRCILTALTFTHSLRELKKTILEEALHIEKGVPDFSREFQEALLEVTMRAIERGDES